MEISCSSALELTGVPLKPTFPVKSGAKGLVPGRSLYSVVIAITAVTMDLCTCIYITTYLLASQCQRRSKMRGRINHVEGSLLISL